MREFSAGGVKLGGALVNGAPTMILRGIPMETCLIRQPVMDREQVVFGYELLFRNGNEDLLLRLDKPDNELDAGVAPGPHIHLTYLQKITEGRRCFLSFSRKQLLERAYGSLSAESTVVEVFETEGLDEELVKTCHEVRQSGYTLALADAVVEPRLQPLLGIIDLLKVDFTTVSDDQHQEIIQSASKNGFGLVAHGLHTSTDFLRARQFGYTYFQGNFFCHPKFIADRQIPTSHLLYLKLLQVVNQPEFDVDKINELMRQDLSLSVKLLRYLNSPKFALRTTISTIRQALGLMGQRPLRNWVSLITVAELSRQKPMVLLSTSMIRAKFCEAVGQHSLKGAMASEGFLLGMFSLLDAILDQPMADLLQELALSQSIRDALIQIESPLRYVLDLAKALEDGDWRTVGALEWQLQIDDETVFSDYRKAIDWASEVCSGLV